MKTDKVKLVKEVNKLLIKQFGIPAKNPSKLDPLDMLIGTILSQNTNDKNSFQAYRNLRARFPKWEDVLKVSRPVIEKEIKIAGLGLQKSGAIKELLSALDKKYGKLSLEPLITDDNNQILEKLTSFNGVGVKTASCVLLFALDRNVCPVDTHVHRTVNRIGIVAANTPDKTFEKLNTNFPPNIAHSFHTNLIRLGREICKPSKPGCTICPVKNLCQYDQKSEEPVNPSKPNSFMLLDNI